jgi:tRNA (cytidine/uridine-2'-O-)-methyltransferase
MLLHVVLYQPQIPPNTGNVMRLCANTGARLYLIGPLGFELDDRRMRRAGLDYGDWCEVRVFPGLDAFHEAIAPSRVWAVTTRGQSRYDQVDLRSNDALLFGPETRGLPHEVLATLPESRWLRIPMRPNNRSLNLSNAVAVVVYEAWRQAGFIGGV